MVQGQRFVDRRAFADDGVAGRRHAHGFLGALLVDVSTRGRAAASGHVNLVMQALEELLGWHGASTGADDAGATGRFDGDAEALRSGHALEGARVVHLRKVRTNAGGDTGCTGDQLWVLLVRDGLATGVHPDHSEHAKFVRLADEGGRFSKHLMFVLAAEVDRVADAHDVDAVVDQGHHVVHVPHRHAHGVTLGRLDKVRL